ncbi:MAG TPA: hypothetical protein VFW44_20995 [Bryobacteraceae bacterium]|nr:hypothetical protein [Bryobacteraceae bacterium]
MRILALGILSSLCATAQTYNISTVAGMDRFVPGLQATSVPFFTAANIAIDSSGNVIISDLFDDRVRYVTPSGIVGTLAGNGSVSSPPNAENVPATSASMLQPMYVTADGQGNTYVYESTWQRIRKISANGLISTFAGVYGGSFDDKIPATTAFIDGPMVADAVGNVYVSGGGTVRKIGLDGIIRTIAGTGAFSKSTVLSGPAMQVNLSYVESLAMDSSRNIYFADSGFGLIRKLTPDGNISTIAGTLVPGVSPPSPLAGPVPATTVSIAPTAIATDDKYLYMISEPNGEYVAYVYRVSLATGMLEVMAGGSLEYPDDDEGPASQARFGNLTTLAAKDGVLYIADGYHVRVMKNGAISNFAGLLPPDGVQARGAPLLHPHNLSRDSAGNVFFIQDNGGTVQRVGIDGILRRVDGPWGTNATAIASDYQGNTYIAKAGGQIYRLPSSGSPVLVAGAGTASEASGDNGPALQANFNPITALAVDGAGDIFVNDGTNLKVRKITAANGIVTTIAGNGTFTYLGDSVSPLQNGITPCGLAADFDGNLYIGDLNNYRVFQLTAGGQLNTLAGTGVEAESGDGGPAVQAALSAPCIVAVDSAHDIYVSDTWGGDIRRIDSHGIINTIARNESAFPSVGIDASAADGYLEPLAVDQFGVV